MPHSTRKRKRAKPKKPHPDFPLFAHANGLWAKKIRGRLHYFGKWDDSDGALEKWNRQKDALLAGRVPRDDPDATTLRALCNHFMTAKRRAVDAGEVVLRTFYDYHRVCQGLIDHFGPARLVDDLRPEDFGQLRGQLVKRFDSPVTLKVYVCKVKSIFGFAYENNLIDRPVKFGSEFCEPRQKVIDAYKLAGARQMFEREEILALLKKACPEWKAMILLAVNAGFGNTDLATLREPAIDFVGGWVEHPRPKTAVNRKIPLWPETLEAIRKAINTRPEANDPADADRVFLTKAGRPWVREKEVSVETDAGTEKKQLRVRNTITETFARLLKRAGVSRGRGFYCLRHTCETIAGDSRDQIAVDAIMGHRTPGTGTQYRERIEDARLREVTEHVRRWLYGKALKQVKDSKTTKKKLRVVG